MMTEIQKTEHDRILASGTGDECVKAALDYYGSDVHALVNRVLEVGTALDCYRFIAFVPTTKAADLEQRMLYLNNSTSRKGDGHV